MAKKKEEGCNVWGRELRSHYDAWHFADEEYPINVETLKKINLGENNPMLTKEDFRWFVLLNMLRSILYELNDSIERTYLQRIQDNILASAERYLK